MSTAPLVAPQTDERMSLITTAEIDALLVQLRTVMRAGVVLAGQRYVPGRAPSIEQLTYITIHMRRAEWFARCRAFDLGGTFRTLVVFNSLLIDLKDSAGQRSALFPMLAGVLSADGQRWSESAALRAAAVFSTITAPAEKQRIDRVFQWLVFECVAFPGETLEDTIAHLLQGERH